MKTMTFEQYLRSHHDLEIRATLARCDRGDFNYIDALERIAVNLLGRLHTDSDLVQASSADIPRIART